MTSTWGRTPQFGSQTPMVGNMTPSYGSLGGMTPLPGGGMRTPIHGSQTPLHGDGKLFKFTLYHLLLYFSLRQGLKAGSCTIQSFGCVRMLHSKHRRYVFLCLEIDASDATHTTIDLLAIPTQRMQST